MPAAKSVKIAELQALATATPKYMPNMAFLIASKSYTTAQVTSIVNEVLASATEVATATAAAKSARLADEKTQAQYAPFIRELRQIVTVAYSNAIGTLEDFGITPPKPRAAMTIAEKAAADAKAKATRMARGTKGKRQKAAITGNVSGVTITPITTGTAAATAVASSTAVTPPAAPSTPSSPPVSPAVVVGAAGTAAGAPHA